MSSRSLAEPLPYVLIVHAALALTHTRDEVESESWGGGVRGVRSCVRVGEGGRGGGAACFPRLALRCCCLDLLHLYVCLTVSP